MVRGELREPVRRAAQHQQVALPQLDLREPVADPGLAAPHADDHDVERLQEIDRRDGLADERRMRRDDHLHELGRLVEFPLARFAVLLDRMQGEARFAFDRDDRVRGGADEQHVALGEHRAAVLVVLRHAVPEPLDDLDAAVVILVEIRHRLPDPARLRLDDELGVVTVEAQVFRLVRARLALRQDPAAERHIDDGEQHERDADRRDAEDPERLLPARLEQVVHQEEGRGAEDRERRAERRGERHRHQEPRGRQVLHPREPHHDRQHHRRDHEMVRERRERRDRGHHDEDRAPFTAHPRRARCRRRSAP